MNKNIKVFLILLRAGLWEKKERLSAFSDFDITEVYRLAEEQSVVGIVAAGLDQVQDGNISQEGILQLVGTALQIEQQNVSMNSFIGELFEKLQNNGVHAFLIKGQCIAQCYERPLWRTCGDVDLFLSIDNYNKAYDYFLSASSSHDKEIKVEKHIGFTVGQWVVELHGTLSSRLWKKMDRVLDEMRGDILYRGYERTWMCGNTQVFIFREDENVVYVFSHILKHFFHGGIGLRQVCDWCRILWTYKDSLNYELLESRIRKMGLMTEWKVFASLAVDYLGMPAEAMPLYSHEKRWSVKGNKLLSLIIETGNFGHNRDNSYYKTNLFIVRKVISFYRHIWDNIRYFNIFPMDSIRVLGIMLKLGAMDILEKHGR